ncbi:MBL fold metallo-hydrolase [Haliangium ochraceum]|uniref:Beta-lactamase domain protein n=1 Tax=Haliangium ochraceum (strain DSM 14365 / JCM 11303 / SMP-2) TaxID=502025 RepID=D0LKB7_HALO1|nr:MBL fold metallo-hydrolase [Haliangium ochraceum]ACY13151.1 beta-lactamase domain protein [Haliangium ochraceum DSM 14365]
MDELYRQVRSHLAQPSPPGSADPPRAEEVERPRTVAPGVVVFPVRTPTLPPATHTNCYAIGDREIVLIDPASPDPGEQSALDACVDAWAHDGRRVVAVWLTHHHGDHIGGAAHVAARLKVPIAAHAATAKHIAHRVEVDELLDDGHTLELAGSPACRLRAVFTPGHASGHLCFFEEHSRVLVAGDMVAGVGSILIEPGDGNMSLYLDSLARMKALDASMLLPAHGPMIENPNEKLDAYVRHRLWREERIAAALESLGSAANAALLPLAYADVPPLLYPLAERSLTAHLLKLVADGRIVQFGDTWRTLALGGTSHE